MNPIRILPVLYMRAELLNRVQKHDSLMYLNGN